MAKPIVNLVDSFRLFADKFNVLSNNVGNPSDLNTYQDSDLVTALNEIEAAFDASAGEILYPNGQSGETSTHLKISTNQSSGQDIDIDAGRDFLVDAIRNINLAGVGYDLSLSGNRTVNIDGTSHDSVDGAITVVGGSTYGLTTGGNFTQNTTGTVDINASSDITLNTATDIVLDADGNDIIFKNGAGGDQVKHIVSDNGSYEIDAPSSVTVDAVGDITLDADGNDIIFKNGAGGDTVTHTIEDNGNYIVNAPANIKFDAVGDIILDADGNDLVFRNGAGGDSAQINLADNADLTITAPDDVVVDAENDIVLDANGANVTLKRDGTTRVNYILDATNTIGITGNLDQNVSGNHSDSANGTYHIGATGNFDIKTEGTYDVVSGSNATLDTTGDVLVKATGDITLDAETDIILDANGADIVMKDGGVNKFTFNFGTNQELDVTGNFTVDATGDIILDAGDSDISFYRNGTEFVKTQMGMTGDANLTRHYYGQGGLELDASGNITLDASGDIILDAAADDIILKDAGTEFGRFKHIGSNQLGIYSNGWLAVSFNDSDVVFNSDVNIEDNLDVDGTLNVDGATTLNGAVTLGDATGDDITFTGYVASNIVPKTDNGYNLGSSAKEWKHGYFDGTVFADNLDGDSGTIGNININTNTIKNTGAGIILDAGGDIELNARGEDIVFKTADSDAITWNLGRTNPLTTYATVHNRHFALGADKNIYFDAGEGKVFFRDSADTNRLRFTYNNAAANGTKIEVDTGSLTFDVDGDIVLDADGGDVLLKDGGTQFGRFQNTSGNLIVKSGDTTALTFSGANVTTGGTITPGTTLNTTATDLVGAINELDSDLGTRTSLSSFFDNHDSDIVSALNRVAARIIDVYDENGTLLNN